MNTFTVRALNGIGFIAKFLRMIVQGITIRKEMVWDIIDTSIYWTRLTTLCSIRKTIQKKVKTITYQSWFLILKILINNYKRFYILNGQLSEEVVLWQLLLDWDNFLYMKEGLLQRCLSGLLLPASLGEAAIYIWKRSRQCCIIPDEAEEYQLKRARRILN